MIKSYNDFSINESATFSPGEELIIQVDMMRSERQSYFIKTGRSRNRKATSFDYSALDYGTGKGYQRKRTKNLWRVEFVDIDKGLSNRYEEPYAIVINMEDDSSEIFYIPAKYLVRPSDLSSDLLKLWNEDPSLVEEDIVVYISHLMALAEKANGKVWISPEVYKNFNEVDDEWAGLYHYRFVYDILGSTDNYVDFFNKEEGEGILREMGKAADAVYTSPAWLMNSKEDIDNSLSRFRYKYVAPDDNDDDEARTLIDRTIVRDMVKEWGCESLVDKHVKAAQEMATKIRKRNNASRAGLLD